MKQSMETAVYNSVQALFDSERATKGATLHHSFCMKQSMKPVVCNNFQRLFDAEKAMIRQRQG